MLNKTMLLLLSNKFLSWVFQCNFSWTTIWQCVCGWVLFIYFHYAG